jgi:hypothetical protein
VYHKESDKMRERMLRETEEFLTRWLKRRESTSGKQVSLAAVADVKANIGRNEYQRYHHAERSRS